MKKLLYSLMMLLATVSFVSCSDDEGGNGPAAMPHPEQQIAGTYSGTWTRTLDGESEEGASTVIITASGTEFFADITAQACPAVNLDSDMTATANVTWQSNGGYRVTNYGGANNGFGTSFSAKVTKDGKLSMNFKKTVKVGRKSYEYIFTFEGNK